MWKEEGRAVLFMLLGLRELSKIAHQIPLFRYMISCKVKIRVKKIPCFVMSLCNGCPSASCAGSEAIATPQGRRGWGMRRIFPADKSYVLEGSSL
jgi:hypothetical protein